MKKKRVISWVALIIFVLANYGCSLLGAAVSAGMSYAIYKATHK